MVSVEFAQSEEYVLIFLFCFAKLACSQTIFYFLKNCTCAQVEQTRQREHRVQLYVKSVRKKERNVCRHLLKKKSLIYVDTLSLHYHLVIHDSS